jgi:nickel-dependent lactate racemase
MCLYSDKYHFAEAELFCGNKTKIKNIYNLIEVEIDRRLQCLIRFYTKKDKDFKKLPIKEFIQKYLKVDFDPEIFDSQIIYVRLENL